MKTKRLSILFLAFVIVRALCQPFEAPAADSASFDPVPVPITAESIGGVPIGTIIAWPVGINPADWDKWLDCNGQSIDSTVYPELWALMPVCSPNLRCTPNLQGLFLRGWGSQSHSQVNGSTINGGLPTSTTHQSGSLGQIQGDAIRNIKGQIDWQTNTCYWEGCEIGALSALRRLNEGALPSNQGVHGSDGLVLDSSKVIPVSTENRPVNMAVRYLIRALK